MNKIHSYNNARPIIAPEEIERKKGKSYGLNTKVDGPKAKAKPKVLKKYCKKPTMAQISVASMEINNDFLELSMQRKKGTGIALALNVDELRSLINEKLLHQAKTVPGQEHLCFSKNTITSIGFDLNVILPGIAAHNAEKFNFLK